MMTDTSKKDVLDKGFVRLVDHYGGDGDIIAAARVSISGKGVKAQTGDEGLVRYLMRHRHTTPFEMVDLKFHVRCPIFVQRQWRTHRTFSYNEMSGRYSELPSDYYVPEEDKINRQSKTNKQGRDGDLVDFPVLERDKFIMEADDSFYKYSDRLTIGMTRELARINLPLSSYTEFYVKGNLHNWFHFLSLRMDSHAQYEIRVFADVVGEFVKEVCPMAWRAFEDYRLNSMTFSHSELEILKNMMSGWDMADADFELPTKREKKEFLQKLRFLGVSVDE